METNDYCSYELSKALKACGFDEPCLTFYDANKELGRALDPDNFNHLGETYQGEWFTDTISASTLWQATKWLREKWGIAINVIAHDDGAYDYDIVFLPEAVDCDCPVDRATFSRTYEEALSEGISAALQLLDCSDK